MAFADRREGRDCAWPCFDELPRSADDIAACGAPGGRRERVLPAPPRAVAQVSSVTKWLRDVERYCRTLGVDQVEVVNERKGRGHHPRVLLRRGGATAVVVLPHLPGGARGTANTMAQLRRAAARIAPGRPGVPGAGDSRAGGRRPPLLTS